MSRLVSMVLAAQPGEGFAASRWLAPWGATTVLEHVLDAVRDWPVEPGVVVLGADAEAVLEQVDFADFDVLIDPEWAEGEPASIRVGLDYLQRDQEVDAVLLVAGEVPDLPEGTVEALVAAYADAERPAILPKYRYAPGRPFLLDRALWERFLGLEGDTVPEAVLATHVQWVTEVWIDHVPPRRIVTPDDLQELAPRR